jgi:hypothetical protein
LISPLFQHLTQSVFLQPALDGNGDPDTH